MHAKYRNEVRTESQNLQRFLTKLIALIILAVLPFVGLFAVPIFNCPTSNGLILEINMLEDEASSSRRLKDTLCVSIIETTTGDEYILNTTTGFISIPLAADKHYFIYISKTGAITQSIEFHTTGSENSQSRIFFVDYEPEDVDIDNGVEAAPMSVVKFANDIYHSVEVEQLGINVFHD